MLYQTNKIRFIVSSYIIFVIIIDTISLMHYLIIVKPGSARDHIINQGIDLHGRPHLLIKTTARPIDGAANQAVIILLAQYFDIPRRLIQIQSGHTSRTKLVWIEHESSNILKKSE